MPSGHSGRPATCKSVPINCFFGGLSKFFLVGKVKEIAWRWASLILVIWIVREYPLLCKGGAGKFVENYIAPSSPSSLNKKLLTHRLPSRQKLLAPMCSYSSSYLPRHWPKLILVVHVSLDYRSKGCTPVEVLPVPNAYTTFWGKT